MEEKFILLSEQSQKIKKNQLSLKLLADLLLTSASKLTLKMRLDVQNAYFTYSDSSDNECFC